MNISLGLSLVKASSHVQFVDVLNTLNHITAENKSELCQKNNFGFNCLHALAASSHLRSDLMNSLLAPVILGAFLDKSDSLHSPEEKIKFITCKSKSMFTPLHSAINHGNYYLAIMLFEETRACFKKLIDCQSDAVTVIVENLSSKTEEIDPDPLQSYLEEKNANGFTLYDTYKRNMDIPNSRRKGPISKKNQPDGRLEEALFGKNFSHQQHLANIKVGVDYPHQMPQANTASMIQQSQLQTTSEKLDNAVYV